MLGNMMNNYEVGQYSVALKFIEIFGFIPIILMNTFMPAVTKAKVIGDDLYHSRLTNLYRLMFLAFLMVGVPIYFFSKDVAGASVCVDGCAVTWPPFYKENPSIGTGLTATDFGVITRTDGSKQTTYKGWPLYFYSQDANPGDTNGDGFLNGAWHMAKP